jgi:hypothetical protein
VELDTWYKPVVKEMMYLLCTYILQLRSSYCTRLSLNRFRNSVLHLLPSLLSGTPLALDTDLADVSNSYPSAGLDRRRPKSSLRFHLATISLSGNDWSFLPFPPFSFSLPFPFPSPPLEALLLFEGVASGYLVSCFHMQ